MHKVDRSHLWRVLLTPKSLVDRSHLWRVLLRPKSLIVIENIFMYSQLGWRGKITNLNIFLLTMFLYWTAYCTRKKAPCTIDITYGRHFLILSNLNLLR